MVAPKGGFQNIKLRFEETFGRHDSFWMVLIKNTTNKRIQIKDSELRMKEVIFTQLNFALTVFS